MKIPSRSLPRRALWLALAVLAGLLLLLGEHVLFRVERGRPVTPRTGAGGVGPTPTDSAAAESALHECGGKPGAEASRCYQGFLLRRLSEAGVEAAVGTLRRIGARDRNAEREGHVYAHAIGIAAYRAHPEVGETFARCSEIYQSGCYHGVVQAYFQDVRAKGAAGSAWAADVNRLCEAYRGEGKSRWLLFQCVHGMGHGLTMLHDHDLLRALRDCDLLTDAWDRESCYGGAFMENIVNATSPHHMLDSGRGGGQAGPGGLHDHPGSDGEGTVAATRPRFKPLDPADPLYPCSILEEKYLVACYQMQTSAILHFNHGDIAAAAHACDEAPPAMRTVCYQSLGRDISAYTLQNHAESMHLCSLGDPRYQPWCYVGVVKNFVDLTARTEDGFAFCREVPGDRNKSKCYEAMGEEIGILEAGAQEQEAQCARAEEGYVETCRLGARLPARAAGAGTGLESS